MALFHRWAKESCFDKTEENCKHPCEWAFDATMEEGWCQPPKPPAKAASITETKAIINVIAKMNPGVDANVVTDAVHTLCQELEAWLTLKLNRFLSQAPQDATWETFSPEALQELKYILDAKCPICPHYLIGKDPDPDPDDDEGDMPRTAVAPLCCAKPFCAECISTWMKSPNYDNTCPYCRKSDMEIRRVVEQVFPPSLAKRTIRATMYALRKLVLIYVLLCVMALGLHVTQNTLLQGVGSGKIPSSRVPMLVDHPLLYDKQPLVTAVIQAMQGPLNPQGFNSLLNRLTVTDFREVLDVDPIKFIRVLVEYTDVNISEEHLVVALKSPGKYAYRVSLNKQSDLIKFLITTGKMPTVGSNTFVLISEKVVFTDDMAVIEYILENHLISEEIKSDDVRWLLHAWQKNELRKEPVLTKYFEILQRNHVVPHLKLDDIVNRDALYGGITNWDVVAILVDEGCLDATVRLIQHPHLSPIRPQPWRRIILEQGMVDALVRRLYAFGNEDNIINFLIELGKTTAYYKWTTNLPLALLDDVERGRVLLESQKSWIIERALQMKSSGIDDIEATAFLKMADYDVLALTNLERKWAKIQDALKKNYGPDS